MYSGDIEKDEQRSSFFFADENMLKLEDPEYSKFLQS